MARFTAAQGDGSFEYALLRAGEKTGDLSVASLRSLSPLSDKAQVLVDQAVVKVGTQRLVVAKDIMQEGLITPLSDPLSVTQIEWEMISRTGGAQRTMNPSARGENQLPERTINRIPIYLTTDDFSLGIRTLKMSQRVGQPLDLSLVEQATRRVNEAIEDATINGATTTGPAGGAAFKVDGYGAPGLLNATNANTQTLTAAWATATGAQIQADTMSMISKLQTDLKFGPYNLYVGTAISNALTFDFKANGDKSILSRLREIEAGGRPLKIVTADQMPATQVVMVQMTSDVVDMIVGQPPTVIPWTDASGFNLHWIVMAIMIPRVRTDYEGNSGIVIGS